MGAVAALRPAAAAGAARALVVHDVSAVAVVVIPAVVRTSPRDLW